MPSSTYSEKYQIEMQTGSDKLNRMRKIQENRLFRQQIENRKMQQEEEERKSFIRATNLKTKFRNIRKKKIAELEGKKTNTQLTSRRLMAELDAFTTDFNVIMSQKEQYRSIIKQETISILPDKIQSEIHSVWNNDFSTATLSSFTDK